MDIVDLVEAVVVLVVFVSDTSLVSTENSNERTSGSIKP